MGNEIWGNLFTVAKDVKIQIEFNPSFVQEYRIIGYENRKLAREDFNDDTKDAGEMGSGHTVTAFYELVTTGTADEKKSHSDPLVFQQSTIVPSSDLFQFKLRYKDPKTPNGESILVSKMVNQSEIQSSYEEVSIDYKFATAVIEFGMLLRDSPYKGTASYDTAMQRAIESKGTDIDGYRAELIKMIEMASILNQ
jgi:Ca-activated chloride channel family protein